MQTAVNVPRMTVPKTARKRRRRKTVRRMHSGLDMLKRFIFSARWVSLGLLVLTVYALFIINQDERFFLTYIPVEGALATPPQEVVAASGLAGSHIFAANPEQAARRIGELPGVVAATVTLNWPNRVYIQVSEEKPVAIWQDNGVDYWVTEDGALLPARAPVDNLLQIISEVPLAVEGSEDVAEETAVVPTATVEDNADGQEEETSHTSMPFIPPEVLAGALQLRELRPNINQLYYTRSGGLSYQDGRGWRAYFGSGTDMNQKLVVYETIVENLLARGIYPAYISVSNQEKPFYRAQ